jgi:cysteine synthase
MADTSGQSRSVLAVGAILSGVLAFAFYWNEKRHKKDATASSSAVSYESLIGNTPLILLKEASKLSGCNIYVKMESMNPGGTGKDRAARSMLQEAELNHPNYKVGCSIVEGTSGSTGIALANMCLARGLKLHIVMPDDQSTEKRKLLECLGAEVTIVPNCAISNKDHYVNSARKLAEQLNGGGIFMNQFENKANMKAHVTTTGPEIWKQTRGEIDAFVMASGTGGTISGVSQYLKQKSSSIEIVLSDPQGSSLFNKVAHGVCYAKQQSERTIKKHRYDSIVEGVGLDRVTANFACANIDSAVCVADQEMLDMAHWLLHNEGLFVGSSSALNVVGALKVAKRMPPGSTIVTIICDSGHRHLSRFWNQDYVGKYSLIWPKVDVFPECVQAFSKS